MISSPDCLPVVYTVVLWSVYKRIMNVVFDALNACDASVAVIAYYLTAAVVNNSYTSFFCGYTA